MTGLVLFPTLAHCVLDTEKYGDCGGGFRGTAQLRTRLRQELADGQKQRLSMNSQATLKKHDALLASGLQARTGMHRVHITAVLP